MADREGNREKVGEEGAWRGAEDSNGDDQDPYDRAKRLWGEFLAGKITSAELDKTLGGFESDNRKENIGDLYGAEFGRDKPVDC